MRPFAATAMAIEATQVIQDFAVIMIVASAMALISYKLRQPLVIGYIVAGMIIGPYTPPFGFLLHPEILNLLAEIGTVLLLFVVGLEYPIAKLRSVGRRAPVMALAEALGTFALGYAVARAIGLGTFDGLFLALAISVTSTIIVMRVLEELGMLREEASYLLLGVAVIEDIIIVSMLAVMQSLASTGGLALQQVALSMGLVLAFIAGALFLGSKAVPRFVDFVAGTGHQDLLVVAILGIAFGLALVAALLGVSVAAGAFFAGVLVAESKTHAVARILATPLKDMFAALFFVSVGALMNLSLLPVFIVPALILIGVSFGAKFATVYLSASAQKIPKGTAMRAAFGLSASGGELALVTAKGGANVGATSSFILPMVGTMTIITTFLSPYVIRAGWRYADLVTRPGRRPMDQAEVEEPIGKSEEPASPMEPPDQDSPVSDPGRLDEVEGVSGETD
jgi:CPA2 family monovalent cation:H+ antiporter-2